MYKLHNYFEPLHQTLQEIIVVLAEQYKVTALQTHHYNILAFKQLHTDYNACQLIHLHSIIISEYLSLDVK